MTTTPKSIQIAALEQKMKQITTRGKVFSKQDLYCWIQWHYGKGRWWTDKYILPHLRWKELKSKGYPPVVIGKYITLEELRRELRSILNDYGG